MGGGLLIMDYKSDSRKIKHNDVLTFNFPHLNEWSLQSYIFLVVVKIPCKNHRHIINLCNFRLEER